VAEGVEVGGLDGAREADLGEFLLDCGGVGGVGAVWGRLGCAGGVVESRCCLGYWERALVASLLGIARGRGMP